MNSWADVFNAVKERHSLMSEYELGFHLGIPPATLSHIRTGLRRPSVAVACKILDKAGYALTRDMFLAMLPQTAVDAFLKAERKRMLSAFQRERSNAQYQAILGENGEVDWILGLDTLKSKKKLSADKELALLLDTPTTRISDIRNGVRPMMMSTKLNLLTALGIALDAKTLAKVVPSDIEEAVSQGKLNLEFMTKNA